MPAFFVPTGSNSVGDRLSSGVRGRVHSYGVDWAQVYGATDYWLGGDNGNELGSAGAYPVLADAGWTTTSMTHVAGSGADFASKSDIGIPSNLVTNAASDVTSSPLLFGDFAHMDAAAYWLGTFPQYLMCEMWVVFTTASNNETGTGIGFFEGGGSPIVANDHLAEVYSDATNFGLRSGADSDAGIAVQTTAFGVRIQLAPGTTDKVQWWTRSSATVGFVSQGTIDLETDLFPCGFGFGTVAGGSNIVGLVWAHIFYSQDGRWPT